MVIAVLRTPRRGGVISLPSGPRAIAHQVRVFLPRPENATLMRARRRNQAQIFSLRGSACTPGASTVQASFRVDGAAVAVASTFQLSEFSLIFHDPSA